MSATNPNDGSPREAIIAAGPPYPPQDQGLGGIPAVIPDIPISAVFLALYLVFGIIHITIFKSNKNRGHKFIFNGAILGLCKIRIITMSLRMAWASYPRNTGLSIAANIFVYVGTIILFMINWFFVQRIIRAQHARLGWSTPYRIFHRAGLVVLVTSLLLLIIANIWQFFTINNAKIHVFRILILVGQTYFTAFAFAPAIMVAISLLSPRSETEKFGAGRMRINITILLLAVTVISSGQIFRCVINWIPQTPMRDESGLLLGTPWYLSKACFYCFNFVTEIIVIVLFAVVRVDLRFHVPNGSRMSGDYSNCNSRLTINEVSSKKSLTAAEPIVPFTYQCNESNETIHQYDRSIFDDSKTLADSLKFGHSTLEVDEKTGNWKVKRASIGSRSSRSSLPWSQRTHSPANERSVRFDDELNRPPVPAIPNGENWPLPDTPIKRGSRAVMEHSNRNSSRGTPQQFEIPNQAMNNVDMNDAISDALAKLEQNSEKSKLAQRAAARSPRDSKWKVPASPPPEYNDMERTVVGSKVDAETRDKKTPMMRNPLAPRNRSTYPSKSAMKMSKNNNSASTPHETAVISEAPETPEIAVPPKAAQKHTRRSSSVELITITRKPSTDSRRIIDMSLQGDKVDDGVRSASPKQMRTSNELVSNEEPIGVARAPSSAYSQDNNVVGLSREASSKYSNLTTSSGAREAAIAEEEFRRFSYEAPPVSPVSESGK